MRKMYLVPNFITTLNMLCGFYSIVLSFHREFELAAWLIIAAGVCDMLDGRIARLAKVTSSFGVAYDSLSDLVSFGVAPAMLLYIWAMEPYGRYGILASFLYLACGAFRLARFNVSTTADMQHKEFQGMPIPTAAGIVATFILFNNEVGFVGENSYKAMALIFIFGLGSLMVSTIPFPSLKKLNWRSKASFGYLLFGVMTMVLIAVKPEVTLFFIGMLYLVVSLFKVMMHGFRARALSRTGSQGKLDSRSTDLPD